ncbi:MAG: 3-deoxy-D-manno-octulosonic acid transferase [bacterium]
MLFLYLIKNKHASGFFHKLVPSLSFTKDNKNNNKKSKSLWIHAVSVGEVNASFYFINLLLNRINNNINSNDKQKKIYLSVVTRTGYENAIKKFKEMPVFVIYFPYDFLFSVKNFINLINPVCFISIETEIWPNLFNKLKKTNIPIFILNARLSDKSFRNYYKFKFFFIYIFECIDLAACISKDYYNKFLDLGMSKDKLYITGNMKFDTVQKEEIEKLKIEGIKYKDAIINIKSNSANQLNNYITKIIIAGSTHEREEQIILDIFLKLVKNIDNSNYNYNRNVKLYLMIAPRHPERFQYVSELIKKYKLDYVKISSLVFNHDIIETNHNYTAVCENNNVIAEYDNNGTNLKLKSYNNIIIVDKMGILNSLYSIADIAFIGGSMVPPGGGHNMLEPLSFGVPVVFGNFVENFQEIADEIISSGAGIMAANPEELFNAIYTFINDKKKSSKASIEALNIIERNQGSSVKNLNLLINFGNII